MNRRSMSFALCFLAIVCVAAGLRLAGLGDAGIFGVDGGRYILDGLSKANELENGIRLLEGKWSELTDSGEFLLSDFAPEAAERLAQQYPFSPKLGVSYLTGMVLLWTGPWVSAFSVIEAIAGILLVAVVIVFVGRLRDWPTGLLAGLLLAVSGYSVYYARNAYPQSTASLCYVLAVWAHTIAYAPEKDGANGMRWYLVMSGALAGIGFWINYQIAGALPALAAIQLLASLRGGGPLRSIRQFVSGGLLMTAGFLAVQLAAEAVTYPWILLFRSQGLTYPHATYLELLWPRLVSQSGAPVNMSGLVLLPYFHGVLEGYPATLIALVLLTGGGLVAIGTWASGDSVARYRAFVYVMAPFAVPVLIFSLKTMQGARTFTFALPFLAALLAMAVVAIWRYPTSYRAPIRMTVVVLLGISLASSLVYLREILAIRSAYPVCIAHIKGTDSPGASAAWSSALESYLLQEGLDGGSLYRYVGEERVPPRWYVSDWQELYDRRYPDEAVALPTGAEPDRVFDHSFGRIFLEVEAFPSYGNTIDNIRFVQNLDLNRARKLLVYDLHETGLRSPLTMTAPPPLRD